MWHGEKESRAILGHSVIYDGHIYTVITSGGEQRFNSYETLLHYLKTKTKTERKQIT